MLNLRPSNANRWVHCPGSAPMEAATPKVAKVKHPVTLEGIAAHWVADRCMAPWMPCNTLEPLNAADFLGKIEPETGLLIDNEMVYGAMLYMETVWARVYSHLDGFQTEKQLSAHPHIEKNSGRCDAIWRSADGSWLSIWDFKFGYNPVRAFENWQAINYALASITDKTRTVEIVIVQPRGSSASKPVKTWQFPVEEFRPYAERIIGAAAESRSANPRIIAGGHCYKCDAAYACETLAAYADAAFEIGASPVPEAPTNEELAHALEQNDRAEKMLSARQDALEGLAVSRIECAEVIPGFEQKRGLTNKRWLEGHDIVSTGKLFDVDLTIPKAASPAEAKVLGLPTRVIEMFTERKATAAKLVRTARNEAREIFRK